MIENLNAKPSGFNCPDCKSFIQVTPQEISSNLIPPCPQCSRAFPMDTSLRALQQRENLNVPLIGDQWLPPFDISPLTPVGNAEYDNLIMPTSMEKVAIKYSTIEKTSCSLRIEVKFKHDWVNPNILIPMLLSIVTTNGEEVDILTEPPIVIVGNDQIQTPNKSPNRFPILYSPSNLKDIQNQLFIRLYFTRILREKEGFFILQWRPHQALRIPFEIRY